MALKNGYSKATISANIAEMRRSGKSAAVASAAALRSARTAWRKKHPTGAFPEHLKPKGSPAKRKTNPVKKKTAKRVGTSRSKPSMITKRAPTKRLVKRRTKNTRPGYYPNPAKRLNARPTGKSYIVGMSNVEDGKTYYVSATVHGVPVGGDTDENKAMQFTARGLAVDVGRQLQDEYPHNIVFVRHPYVR